MDKESRLINEEYFKSLITREIKMCLLKENYKVGIYTFIYQQHKYVLDIIKNIIQDIGLIKNNHTYILIVFDNGSFIKILSCDKSIRGDRFNDVIINNLINRQDVDEVILPTLRFYEDDTNNIRDKVFYCEF